jgi:hypothetical protein
MVLGGECGNPTGSASDVFEPVQGPLRAADGIERNSDDNASTAALSDRAPMGYPGPFVRQTWSRGALHTASTTATPEYEGNRMLQFGPSL